MIKIINSQVRNPDGTILDQNDEHKVNYFIIWYLLNLYGIVAILRIAALQISSRKIKDKVIELADDISSAEMPLKAVLFLYMADDDLEAIIGR